MCIICQWKLYYIIYFSPPQAIILSKYYPYNVNWVDAIYIQYIKMGNEQYFNEFMKRVELTDNMIEKIVKK